MLPLTVARKYPHDTATLLRTSGCVDDVMFYIVGEVQIVNHNSNKVWLWRRRMCTGVIYYLHDVALTPEIPVFRQYYVGLIV